MSPGSRLAIVLVAVVALVIGFAALRPADDDAPAPTPDVATAPAEPPASTGLTPLDQTTTLETTVPPEAEPPLIRVVGGKRVDGPEVLEFEAGDDVVFRVRSDVAEEIHVHGYDKYVDLEPGKAATVRIENAKLEGAFEVELHGAGAKIAELRVAPS